jgi:hypothetical protein
MVKTPKEKMSREKNAEVCDATGAEQDFCR